MSGYKISASVAALAQVKGFLVSALDLTRELVFSRNDHSELVVIDYISVTEAKDYFNPCCISK